MAPSCLGLNSPDPPHSPARSLPAPRAAGGQRHDGGAGRAPEVVQPRAARAGDPGAAGRGEGMGWGVAAARRGARAGQARTQAAAVACGPARPSLMAPGCTPLPPAAPPGLRPQRRLCGGARARRRQLERLCQRPGDLQPAASQLLATLHASCYCQLAGRHNWPSLTPAPTPTTPTAAHGQVGGAPVDGADAAAPPRVRRPHSATGLHTNPHPHLHARCNSSDFTTLSGLPMQAGRGCAAARTRCRAGGAAGRSDAGVRAQAYGPIGRGGAQAGAAGQG
jgi:hypothetical protein